MTSSLVLLQDAFIKYHKKNHIFSIQVPLVKSSYLPPNPQKLKCHWHTNLNLRGNTWKQKGRTTTNNSCVNDNNEVNWSTSKNKFKTCGLFIWFLLMYHKIIMGEKIVDSWIKFVNYTLENLQCMFMVHSLLRGVPCIWSRYQSVRIKFSKEICQKEEKIRIFSFFHRRCKRRLCVWMKRNAYITKRGQN